MLSPGIRVDFSNQTMEFDLSTNTLQDNDFDLSVSSTANDVVERLVMLPGVEEPILGYTGQTSTASNSQSWTLSFSSNQDDVPQLSCIMPGDTTGCSVTTLLQGNSIGGYFHVNGSQPIPSDASADTLQSILEVALSSSISVSRTEEDDGQGGHTWTITFPDLVGDVPLLETTNRLTGYSTNITVKEVTKGNAVSGNWSLGFKGHVTSIMPFDATVEDVASALEELDVNAAIPLLGGVSVSLSEGKGMIAYDRTSPANDVFSVTFLDYKGDAPLLEGITDELIGLNSQVLVNEDSKGEEASGSQLSISFEPPRWCSTSQVGVASCGNQISYYLVEWDTSPTFSSSNKASEVLEMTAYTQNIKITNATWGTFRLAVSGSNSSAYTEHLSLYSSAHDVRAALEALPGVAVAKVSRSYAPEDAGSAVYILPASQGDSSVMCSIPGCFSSYSACMPIRIGNEWYTTAGSYVSGSDTITLASESDCATLVALKTFADKVTPWAKGYTWTVKGLKEDGETIELLTSPMHDLRPKESVSLTISRPACIRCMRLSDLTLGTTYHVRVTPYNSWGPGMSSTTSIIPNQAPLAPENVGVQILSGQRAQVSFCNPLVHAGDIRGFRVQWDSDITFSNAVGVTASCTSVGFGSCVYSGSAIYGECPFYYVVTDLTPGETYYLRVSALGDIEAPVIRGVDTTSWSGVLSLIPENQPPGAPISVVAHHFSGDSIQVHVNMPTEDGGLPIESLIFEVDTVPYFTSDSLMEEEVQVSSLPFLEQGGEVVVHRIVGLTAGEAYYVRVKAMSDIGTGVALNATRTPIVPKEAAGPVN